VSLVTHSCLTVPFGVCIGRVEIDDIEWMSHVTHTSYDWMSHVIHTYYEWVGLVTNTSDCTIWGVHRACGDKGYCMNESIHTYVWRIIYDRVIPSVKRKGLTRFARRNKACFFSPLYILKLGLSPEIPTQMKIQNTTFWCIEVSYKPSTLHSWSHGLFMSKYIIYEWVMSHTYHTNDISHIPRERVMSNEWVMSKVYHI